MTFADRRRSRPSTHSSVAPRQVPASIPWPRPDCSLPLEETGHSLMVLLGPDMKAGSVDDRIYSSSDSLSEGLKTRSLGAP